MAIDERRTLFATTTLGRMFVLRRYDPPGEPLTHELSLYDDYLSPAPKELSLPDALQKSFDSEAEAVAQVRQHWHEQVGPFEDVRLGHRMTFDLAEALRQGSLKPLRASMSAEEVVDLLGLPEDVAPTSKPGCVRWFYGAVQVHLEDGRFRSLQVEDAVESFTTLDFTGWFLKPSMTKRRLEGALKSRGIPFTREGQVISVPGGFLFDFHAEVDRLHAFSWNPPRAVACPLSPFPT
ncbi:hypothetical protein COCOR_08101 [Corallococcus coralloides DSM 2259]|uniref:Uncharacterized protein n=1 Tax=Corallococcus coralloides (strain ATCC 25202 / DSM 2259 / NBRC 100086 / M2) TaxID=1144275 RepID=H8N145_CORCM|nr:hypothetical protein [Corallococcus coralloides]AFE07927.1 hypothetical protein COCOR_08101 [Corallococcus coralloides DSM 2259]